MQPAAPTAPVENPRGKDWRLLNSLSRSSEEASSTGGSSYASPDVPEVDNSLPYASMPIPDNRQRDWAVTADTKSNVRDEWSWSRDSGTSLQHSNKNPVYSTAANYSEMAHHDASPSNTRSGTGVQHGVVNQSKVQEKDEESSFSSFPLLSTDALRHQVNANQFPSGSYTPEMHSNSSSSDSDSTEVIGELLSGSFPSPNRGSTVVQRSDLVGANVRSVRFADSFNPMGEPRSSMENPPRKRLISDVRDDNNRGSISERSRAMNTPSGSSSWNEVKDSPTSVMQLQQKMTIPNAESPPKRLLESSSRAQQIPSRHQLKSILRTRRVVVDCPSDEGSRKTEQNEVERDVRISGMPASDDEARISLSPLQANETEFVDEKGVVLSPIEHILPASLPRSPGDKSEVTLDYSQDTEETPHCDEGFIYPQLLERHDQESQDGTEKLVRQIHDTCVFTPMSRILFLSFVCVSCSWMKTLRTTLTIRVS